MSAIEVKRVNHLKGHRDAVFALDYHNESNFIFSAGADGMAVLWDISQENLGKIIAKVSSSVYALRYIKEDDHLILGQNFDGIHLLELESKKEVDSVHLTKSYIFDIQYTKDYILVAEGQGRVLLLDKGTLKILHVWDDTDKSARSISLMDNFAVIGFSDNFIRVYDLKSRKKINEWQAHDNSVFKVVFTSKGNIISTSRDARIKFWDFDGKLDQEIIAHMYAINDFVFSPDGNYFATCSMDKSIKLWDFAKRKLLKVIDKGRHAGHGTSVNKLLWTSFNNNIVSCSDDQTISVWDVKMDEK